MPPSSATPVSGEVLGEKYRLERLIGEGGMGCVFEAVNVLTDRRVAVKWLKPELAHNPDVLQRFLREARLTSRIDHPNVVQVLDVARHGEAYFLVMELLHGESLAHAVASRMLAIQEAVDIMMSVMRGVAEAHQAGVVHRDLKPDNIFLCVDRRGHRREPKVLDFGISKLQTRDSLETTTAKMTREGQMLGTPYYMSPEQLEGGPDVDARADVYALGVIMYEVLTRRVPFEADTLTGILMRIIENRPRPPSELRAEVPAALEAIILKAMGREPKDRYQSVEELARALEPFATTRFSLTSAVVHSQSLPFEKTLAHAQTKMQTQTPMVADEAVQLPVRRVSPALWIGLGVAAVAVAGWAWVATHSASEPQAPVATVAPPAEVVPRAEVVPVEKKAVPPPEAAPAVEPTKPVEPAAVEPAPVAAAPEPLVPVERAQPAAVEPAAPGPKPKKARPQRPQAMGQTAALPEPDTAPAPAPAPAPKKKKDGAAPELVGF